MKPSAMLFAAIAACSVAACNPSTGPSGGSHIDCAALISAANRLVLKGKAEKDAVLEKHSLVAMMTHLNTYAVPKGLSEQQAFAELNALRASLLKTQAPDNIMRRARRCADRIPR